MFFKRTIDHTLIVTAPFFLNFASKPLNYFAIKTYRYAFLSWRDWLNSTSFASPEIIFSFHDFSI